MSLYSLSGIVIYLGILPLLISFKLRARHLHEKPIVVTYPGIFTRYLLWVLIVMKIVIHYFLGLQVSIGVIAVIGFACDGPVSLSARNVRWNLQTFEYSRFRAWRMISYASGRLDTVELIFDRSSWLMGKSIKLDDVEPEMVDQITSILTEEIGPPPRPDVSRGCLVF